VFSYNCVLSLRRNSECVIVAGCKTFSRIFEVCCTLLMVPHLLYGALFGWNVRGSVVETAGKGISRRGRLLV